MALLDIWRDDRPSRSLQSSWDSITRDFQNMFQDFERYMAPLRGSDSSVLVPSTDIEEMEDGYMVSMDMPGVNEEDINIEVSGHQVIVSAERHMEHEEEKGKRRRIERAYGQFQRTFTLTDEVDVDRIEADYSNGVLRINIPRAEAAQSRRIELGNKGKGVSQLGKGDKEKQQRSETKKASGE